MEQIVVKTEMQPNGEILLFYVDENEAQSVNIENHLLQMHEGGEFEIQQLGNAVQGNQWVTVQEAEPEQNLEQDQELEPDPSTKDKWSDEEVKRLLVFYIDNKDSFTNGSTKKHLWAIACKTMLLGKSPQTCEVKLRNLKRRYSALLVEHHKGGTVSWPLFELCHQAFHDNPYVQFMLREHSDQEQKLVKVPIAKEENPNDGIIVVKNVNTRPSCDSNVELMLNLYLRYKKKFQKDYWRKDLWTTIALELGEEDAEYWHKRFLNFKQHYLRMVAKRDADGPASVNWPYMNLFDQIFADDPEFQRKYGTGNTVHVETLNNTESVNHYNDWNDTEMMILVKYCFDCFDEFQDSTIPDNFLWNEVGRLLDKKADACKQKYEELRQAHLEKYIQGGYDLRSRNPLAIVLDNIISNETEVELSAERNVRKGDMETEEMDELVKFLYDNIEMFKDPVCYNVCFASIAVKLDKSVNVCKNQWEDLKGLYKTLLEEKKEDPDMQIDWRYIDLFDRIFDYGMDTNLLDDFQEYKQQHNVKTTSSKVGVKKVNIKMEHQPSDVISDDEEFDERGFTKRSKRGVGDSKAFKILEFYQKNKEKFSTTQRKKQTLWENLAQQIGLTGEQCAHRFRNLKQVYTAYVQREINKPEMPILWPYYALCKKVFGYRAIKSKLKNNKMDSEDAEDWAAKEIKQIINYFASNFAEISNGADNDSGKWSNLAQIMGKSETSVNEKFLELRRSYRKLRTMKQNNPECKVSWKYYNLFDDVYNRVGNHMEVEELEVEELTYDEEMATDEQEKAESQDEEDYECIIVIPEGQDLSDISDANIILQRTNQEESESTSMEPESIEVESQLENKELQGADILKRKPVLAKWMKKSKKKLIILYLNYVRARKGKEINPSDMWVEIASKLPGKTPLACRKMLSKLKINHVKFVAQADDSKKKSPYFALLQKVMSIKPKFTRKNVDNSKDCKVYKDVLLPTAKVELALQYYLQHIEEFSSPKFEKKYLWTELANFVSEPVNKLFNKINYLKQYYTPETDEVNGEKTLFGELLKEILNKEKVVLESNEADAIPASEDNEEVQWTDEETEQLLVWYLTNLEKFKNPKFVRKYLWIEASSILEKSPLACSKKMSEIRTQYKTMIKESPDELNSWMFYELCQKIYGTGKKSEANMPVDTVEIVTCS